MKKVMCLALFYIFFTCSIVNAVSDRDFTLSIVHDEYPVREIDNRVSIPFDTEYRIRLKNGHARKCTAKVFIDGAPVSKLGDFILDANTEIDLERFLDSSLTEGKRFKFVRLSHPDVDDPTRKENGIVRVEFRLEKEYYHFKADPQHRIMPPQGYPPLEYWYKWDSDEYTMENLNNFNGITDYGSEATIDLYSENTSVYCSNTSSTAPGATIAGSESNQTFHKSHIDAEDRVYALELRMVGIIEVSQLPW